MLSVEEDDWRLLLFVAVVVLLSIEQVVSDVAADKVGISSARVLSLTTLEHSDAAAALASAVTVAVVVLVDKVGASSCKVVGAPLELIFSPSKALSFKPAATVRRLLSSLLIHILLYLPLVAHGGMCLLIAI